MTIKQLFNIQSQTKIIIIFIKNGITLIKVVTKFGFFLHILYNSTVYFINLSNYLIWNNLLKKINIYCLIQPIFIAYYLHRYYLKLKGLGFSIKYLITPKHSLLLSLGFSKVRYIQIPQLIRIIKKPRKKKYIFTLFSTNNKLLLDFIYLVRKLKIPDPYKLKGFKYIKEIVAVKTGKKKK